jgi:hypothetical protein
VYPGKINKEKGKVLEKKKKETVTSVDLSWKDNQNLFVFQAYLSLRNYRIGTFQYNSQKIGMITCSDL